MKKSLPLYSLLAAVAIVSLLIGAWLGRMQYSPPAAAPTLAELRLPDIDKNLRHGEEWLGKIVIVNHWASWCPPCLEEIPLLIEAQNQYRENGIQVIGVAHDLIDTARAFSDQMGINYPSLVAIDNGNELLRQQGNSTAALPFTVFFDREGNWLSGQLGQLSHSELHKIIAALLREHG